jgi:hypothetical protein
MEYNEWALQQDERMEKAKNKLIKVNKESMKKGRWKKVDIQ